MQKQEKDKIIKWKITLDGEDYVIKVDLKPWTGMHKIYVDDEPVAFDTPAIISFISGFDQYIKIGDNDIFVTCRNGKLDLSVNGKMRSNNKPFVPMPEPAKWMWVLCAFCLPLPVATYFINAKLTPIVIGVSIAAVFVCIYFGMQVKDEKTRARKCTLAVGIPWTVFVFMPLFSKFFTNILS